MRKMGLNLARCIRFLVKKKCILAENILATPVSYVSFEDVLNLW